MEDRVPAGRPLRQAWTMGPHHPVVATDWAIAPLLQNTFQRPRPRTAALEPDPPLHQQWRRLAVQERSWRWCLLNVVGHCVMDDRSGQVMANEVSRAIG